MPRLSRVLATVLLLLTVAAGTATAQVTTLSIVEKAGITTANYPVTLSLVFRQGDVASHVYASINGVNVNTQTDVKVRWPDGSVKHALVSFLIPSLAASSTATVAIYSGGTNYNTDWVTRAELEATAFNASMLMTVSGTPTTITARQLLTSQGTEEHWIKGNICSEFIIRHWPTNVQVGGVNRLNVQYHVRTYPGYSGGNNFRIDAVVENCWANAQGNVTYDFNLKVGNPLVLVFAKTGLTHIYNSRWHKVVWQGATPPAVEIRYNTAYMNSTGLVLPLDTSLTMDGPTMTSAYSTWQASSHDLMQTGILNTYFGAPGDADQLGPYPVWTSRYLLSMDNRMKEIMLNCADVAAGIQIHAREPDPARPSYGRSLSFLYRPTADLDNPTTGDPWDQLGAIIGPTTTPWSPDTAHQPSFSYVPYLVTGDLFYLEEVYFWPSWSLMGPTAGVGPPSREYDKGIIYGDGQPRARARVLQNVAAAAGIAPDTHTIEKETWTASVVNTLAKWQTIYVNNTTDYPLVHTLGAGTGEALADMDADVYVVCSPWMDAYGVWALRHTLELGLNPAGHTLTMLNWLGDQVINQFSAPGFNWNRKVYRMPIARRDQYQVLHYATTWAEVDDMFLDDVGPSDLPNPDLIIGYTYTGRSALAQMLHLPAAQTAYTWLDTHIHSKDQLAINPKFSLVNKPMDDAVAPAAVADLAAGTPTTSSLVVTWTAPGDDGSTGTAKVYDLRYSTQPITDTTWPRATLVSGEPTPAAAGTAQNKTITGLAYDTTYYFAIKTTDEKGNTSALSNVPGVATSLLPGTQTITLQNGVLPTTGYAGCMDNQMHAGSPTTNYGNNDSGTIGNYGNVRRILVRFDVSAIPAGRNVVSAKLRLYQIGWGGGGGAQRMEAYEVLRAWTEMNSCWNNYDTGLAWTTAGCNGIGTDRSGVPAGTATFQPTVGQWVEVTLPNSLVQGWYTSASTNKGLLLKSYYENGGYVVLASDSHATAANRPMLIVSYLKDRKVGDINGDDYVNVGDLQALVDSWAKMPADFGFEPWADVNADGYVNVGDLQLLVVHWGE